MLFLRPLPKGHLRCQDGGWTNWALWGCLLGVGPSWRQACPFSPFTRKEDDLGARIIWVLFSAMIVYMWRVVFSPSTGATIILCERKDDPGTRMILPPCKWPQKAQFADNPETGDGRVLRNNMAKSSHLATKSHQNANKTDDDTDV